MKKKDVDIPRPSVKEVEKYLKEWSELENYVAQEKALDKLFKKDAVDNIDMSNILLKTATLNTFYSTNIYSIYPVACRIKEIDNLDKRLADGDISLVDEIKKVKIKDTEHVFLSFASKYCSHHNQDSFPIYDYYVEAMLKYFRNCKDVDGESFYKFKNDDFKDKDYGYREFCNAVSAFRSAYGLEQFSVKDIDRYLWLTGKKYFLRKYSKKKKENPAKDN